MMKQNNLQRKMVFDVPNCQYYKHFVGVILIVFIIFICTGLLYCEASAKT